ncbi:MAG: hypothetical protein ACQESR_09735 [Planctomycetota bacterium]
MESYPTQAVLPLVGLAADKVIRDRYNQRERRPYAPHCRQSLTALRWASGNKRHET